MSTPSDLAVRLDEAFVEFAAIDVIADQVAAASERFQSWLVAVDDGTRPLLFDEARGRETVLRQGIDDLLLVLGPQPLPEACDVEELRSALER